MPDEQPIDDDSNNAHNDKMRRYPSSHIRREVLQTNSNPKYQVLAKYSFWRGGVTPDQRKSHAPSPDQIFIFGGGGTLDTTSLKYLSGGTQGILHQKYR